MRVLSATKKACVFVYIWIRRPLCCAYESMLASLCFRNLFDASTIYLSLLSIIEKWMLCNLLPIWMHFPFFAFKFLWIWVIVTMFFPFRRFWYYIFLCFFSRVCVWVLSAVDIYKYVFFVFYISSSFAVSSSKAELSCGVLYCVVWMRVCYSLSFR